LTPAASIPTHLKANNTTELTLSNPILLPTAYSPAFVLGGKEVGGLLVIILQF
jgi:hypothetical protein